jgi:putative ABC transport system permease protein
LAGWAVVLRGIRYRSGRSLVVLLLASIATAATVLAPAYSRAAQQSVLSDGLTNAAATATGLRISSEPIAGEPPAAESTTEAKLDVRQLLTRRSTLSTKLAQPVASADLDTVATPGSQNVAARMAYRDNACAHLTMTAGECARDSGTAIVSERSAKEYGLTVGRTLHVHARTATPGSSPRSFTVVGLYTPKNPSEEYWGRGSYFAAGAPDTESALPRIDAVFVGDEQDLTMPGGLPSVHLDYPLRADLVHLDDVPRLRADLSGLETDVNGAQMQLTSSLRGVLDDIDADAATLGRTVPVVAVPLVLVCWFILFLLVAALTEERSPEVALAKLRGYSPGRSARFGRAEAVALVLASAPIGLILGLAAVEAAARTMLGSGVHIELRWPVAVAAVVSVVAGLIAIRLASARTLARPVLSLLRRVPERGRWQAGAVEGAALALAGASLFVAVSDQTSPLALLAPALIAVVAGIVTARLLGIWSTLRARRYGRKGRVTGLLAHAQLSRRPLAQRIMLVVTVAVALLSFSATAWDVAAEARADVAADSLGADRVLRVQADDPAALAAAVDSAAGGAAASTMPVVRVTERYGDGTVELLGLRSQNLADVAVWRGHSHAAVADLANKLRPPQAPPLIVSDFVQVDADTTALTGKVQIFAVLAPSGQPSRSISLGTLHKGARHYRGTTDCGGCRLIGLAVARSSDGEVSGHLRVQSVSTHSGNLQAGFDGANRWRARATSGTLHVQPGPALDVEFATNDPSTMVVDYVDAPDVVPVALSGPTPADDVTASDFTFPGLGDSPQRFQVVQREAMLPRSGRRSLLFDLDYAVRAAQRTSSVSDNSRLRYEVWATAQAPADLSKRLAAAGVQVIDEQSIQAEQNRLARGAPALGLRLYLLAGAAAMALAVGAVLLTAYVGAATRRYELAALRVAGVRQRVLRRGILREYLHLLVAPLVIGLASGVAGAALMLPGIPLVQSGTALGELTYEPHPGVLAVAVIATVVALVLAVLAVLRLVRRATPDRLRDGGLS